MAGIKTTHKLTLWPTRIPNVSCCVLRWKWFLLLSIILPLSWKLIGFNYSSPLIVSKKSLMTIVPPTEQTEPTVARYRVMVGGGLCPEKSSNQTAKLEFIHIRKTGGTAIEIVAKRQADIAWGGLAINQNYGNSTLEKKHYLAATHRSSQGNVRHIPPKYFVPYPFQGVSTFVVTRNPYDRAVSEYYQRMKGRRARGNKKYLYDSNFSFTNDDAYIMNEWIQQIAAEPYNDVFIPQHHYVFDEGGNRIVTHVLEFDHLQEDFDALMECYSILVVAKKGNGTTLTLPKKQINGRIESSQLSKSNLTQATIRAINEFMKKDFELLGYPMMET